MQMQHVIDARLALLKNDIFSLGQNIQKGLTHKK